MKITKKFTLLLFLFTSIMLLTTSVYAEKSVLKAGIVNNYSFSGNVVSDYARGCMDEILKYADNPNLEYIETELDSGIDMLNNGSVDFLCMAPVTDSLKAYADYTSEPMATGFLALYASKYSRFYYEDFSSFNGIRVAVLSGAVYEPYLKEYSEKNGFTYTPVYYDTIDEMLNSLTYGSADAIFTPTTDRSNGLRIIAKCGNVQYYCAVKKGDGDTLNILNNALAELKENNPFYLSQLFTGYFTKPYFSMVGWTEEEYSDLMSMDALRVFIPDDNYPLAYYDADSGGYRGMYAEMAENIASAIGLDIEYIAYEPSEMSMNGIIMGKADAILTVSGSVQGVVEASEPYDYLSYLPIAAKDKDYSEKDNLRVGILSNDAWITDYLSGLHPDWTIEKYNSIHLLFGAARRGSVDIALLSSADLQTKTSLIAYPKLSVIDDLRIDVPVCLGISSITCTDRFINLINKSIKSIYNPAADSNKDLYTINSSYIPNIRDTLYTNKQWVIAGLASVLLIFMVIIWREHHFRRLSMLDELTRIPNMRYFEKNALKIMTKDDKSSYLLISLDIRNFKLINDRFGQAVGDQTLGNIASEIRNLFKDSGALYARVQGDCFLILIKDTPSAREKARRLTDINTYIHNTTQYHIPLKIGVCPIPRYNSAYNLTHYIDRAEIAKESGSVSSANFLGYFNEDMENDLQAKNEIESEMLLALERGDFVVYYQPKYELEGDTIIGAEALVRWNHKEKGLISPGLFIPLFEKNGFIIKLDFYVYECVLKMLRRRIDAKLPVVPVSMNVSRCHLGDTGFADKLENLMKQYNIPKQYIEMEITESIFSEDDNLAVRLIDELKLCGFTISMDDFGSGYSSLNLLQNVPIDTLKIDKKFIDNSDESPKSRIIIEEVICMAAKIRIKTICEGVETATQRDFLKQAGCNMVQGFFYSRPLPSDMFEELLNSNCALTTGV